MFPLQHIALPILIMSIEIGDTAQYRAKFASPADRQLLIIGEDLGTIWRPPRITIDMSTTLNSSRDYKKIEC